MSRCHPYLHRPPPTWDEDIAALQNTTLYVVSTNGPTVFVLKTDDSMGQIFKVYIGERQTCSCGSGGDGRMKLCVHIIFVMIKVLRIPSSNPLSWQLSLIDSEINQILSGEISCKKHKKKLHTHSFLRKGFGTSNKTNPPDNLLEGEKMEDTYSSKQKGLEDDIICPICFDEMSKDELQANLLCYCESSCGSNFHKKCFQTYATHIRSQKKEVICPLCRGAWKKIPCTTIKRKRLPMPLIRCNVCTFLIRGRIYRCVNCVNPNFNLCRSCFEGMALSTHDKSHVFVKTESHQYPANWSTAIPQTISRSLYQGLQTREISDADYNTLLSLDENNIPLHQHLIRALPSVPKAAALIDSKCLYCTCALARGDNLVRLPCKENHVMHASCVLGMLIDFESSGNKYGTAGATCTICYDGTLFFPSLRREPKKKPSCKLIKEKEQHSSKDPTKKASVDELVPSLVSLSVSGTGKSLHIYKKGKA